MTTTYILHGGETTPKNADNDLFFKYFTHFVNKDNVSILMCYFAKEKELWDQRLELDKKRIIEQTSKSVTLSIASDSEDLLKKIETHDVLYVAGGKAELIEPTLASLKKLKDKIKGKIYLGCSMGAFLASTHYVLSFDNQEVKSVHDGLGFLPISTLCHWNIEKNKEQKIYMLKDKAPQLPILALDECKLSIFIN